MRLRVAIPMTGSWALALAGVAALFALSGCAVVAMAPGVSAQDGPTATTQRLPEAVRRALASVDLPQEALAYVVLRADTGAVLAAQAPERPMQPASTLKVLTSAVAFDRLGRAYRGRSLLASSAPIQDGVLHGDLWVRGEGDADLDANAMRRMLHSLKARGVTVIAGDVLLDRSWLAPARPDVGMAPFDETPEFRYNMVPDALSLGTNLIAIDLVSSKDGVSVAMAPPLPKVVLASSLQLADRPCKDWEDGWLPPRVTRGSDGETRVELRGDFPRDCVAATQLNVIDRTDYAHAVLRTLWEEMGGQLRGTVREASDAADIDAAASVARDAGHSVAGGWPAGGIGRDGTLAAKAVLASHLSRPLPELIHDVLKRSDNPNTRLLFYALSGAGLGEQGATSVASVARSAQQVRAWLLAHNISDDGLVLDNGSGLSRSEKITPMQLASTLRVALSKPWAAEFQAAFPVVGVDGGMRNRLASSPLAGRARLKTGTLRDVSALAGYLPGAGGEALVFVAMLNHPLATSKASRPVLDALLEHAATLVR